MSATTATAIVAKAESVGLFLRINQDGEVVMEGPVPPPGLLAELRRHWTDVLHLLRLRRSLGVGQPPGWLSATADAIYDALTAGATQESDADGWFYIGEPGGERIVIAPDTLAQIVEARLLLPLPQPDVVEAQT